MDKFDEQKYAEKIKLNEKNMRSEQVTCPRYVLVRYFREWLTKLVFIRGRYVAVSLHRTKARHEYFRPWIGECISCRKYLQGI